MSKVQGRCPWCGRNTLILGSGGYITCGYIGQDRSCPNPTGVTDLLDGETEHIVELRAIDFTVKHPLHERVDGDLFDCGLHEHIAQMMDGPPRVPGRYRVRWDGQTSTWEAIRA